MNAIEIENNVVSEILEDGNNDWRMKKIQNEQISNSYLRIWKKEFANLKIDTFLNLSENMKHCSSKLDFKFTEDGNKKLVMANFCRARLCPMCSWRRSKKIFGQVLNVINEINKNENYEYIFLTLTCKNVFAKELKNQIEELLKSFTNMMKSKKVSKICKGYFRALEVTYNELETTYHPHIHCIIAVNKSYFTDKTYISQKEWTLLWQKFLKVDYLPIIDVRKFKNNNGKAVAEVSKYTVKATDIIHKNDDGSINEELTDKIIYDLHFALKAKRLVGMGGVFKDYHKKLNLEDLNKDDIDLVNTDKKEIEEKATELILSFNWNVGLKNYYLQKK